MLYEAYGMTKEQALSYFAQWGIYEVDSTTLAVKGTRGMTFLLDLEDDEVVNVTKTCYFC